MLQGVLQLLGQLGLKAGADGKLPIGLDLGFGAGGADGFGVDDGGDE